MPKDTNTETPDEKASVVKAAPPPAAAPAAVPEPERRTPAAWAKQFGHTKPRNPKIPQSTDHVDPKFAVADRLYGWSDRAYHFQAEEDAFLITASVYMAALTSAYQYPACELTQEALTPETAEQFKDFKPARNLKVERAAAEAEVAAKASAVAKANTELKKEPA